MEVSDRVDSDGEPPDHVKLKVRITDEDAIEKVLKGIYFTCSVGSMTSKVRCSVCNQVITEEGLCEHEKGTRTEDGEPVYWIIDEISYRENSFVNNPADPYSRIVSIDIGNGFIPYKEFLDNRDTLINELIMEDSMKLEDAKLSTAARKKLPDSAFCGPDRSFPAHDKAHVTAGLRLLNRSDYSDSTKAKIKACLYRKGKKYGITPSKDELEQTPNMMTYRIDDSFTEEEIAAIKTWFENNPKAEQEEEDAAVVELTDVESDVRSKIIEYFSDKKNTGIQDKDFHKFAEEELGIEESVAETTVYSILSSFFAAGLSKNTEDEIEYDEEQVEMGTKVELEHTSDDAIAKKIAYDHLAEIPDYYTRLAKMEEMAKKELGLEEEDSEDANGYGKNGKKKNGEEDDPDDDDKKKKKKKKNGDEDDSEALTAQIEELKRQLSEKDSILTSKEDEIHKLMDDNARIEESYKALLIDSIVDIKVLKNNTTLEDAESLKKKYITRKIDSLVDTINDLRSETSELAVEDQNNERVENPTLHTTDENLSDETQTEDSQVNVPENVDPKFAPFYQNNWEDK